MPSVILLCTGCKILIQPILCLMEFIARKYGRIGIFLKMAQYLRMAGKPAEIRAIPGAFTGWPLFKRDRRNGNIGKKF